MLYVLAQASGSSNSGGAGSQIPFLLFIVAVVLYIRGKRAQEKARKRDMVSMLLPGEKVLAISHFGYGTGGGRTAVTDQRLCVLPKYGLWALALRLPNATATRPTVPGRAFSLGSISGLSSSKSGTKDARPRTVLTIWVDGEKHVFLSRNRASESAFLDVLRRAVNQRTRGQRPSVANELQKLSKLFGAGVLNEEEWSRAKELFLGKAPDAKENAMENLRKLHELRKSGVLSESEFNMKKWDVLSRSQ